MSSSIASEPLRAVVRPSRLARSYLLIAHGLAFWAVLQSGYLVFLFLLSLSLALYWRQWSRQGSCMFVLNDTDFTLHEGGSSTVYQLGKQHLICHFLVVLQLKKPGLRADRYLVLFSDAMDTEAFRRLRVLLRFPLTQRSEPDGSSVLK